MARLIVDGQLDIHLARPRSPLVSLIFSRAEPEAIGDVLSGIILIIFLGNLSLLGNVAALLLGLIIATILVSTAIIVNSLVFWSGGRTSVVDQIFDVFINLSTMKLAAMGVAALVFPVLAVFVFNRGLRCYTSGNKMLEVR